MSVQPTRRIASSEIVELVDSKGFGGFTFAERNGHLVMLRLKKQGEARKAGEEAGLLSRLSHPNIIHYYGVYFESGNCRLVLEHMTQPLRVFLESQGGSIGATLQWYFVCQLVSTIAFLHEKKIIHRKITSSSFWVNKSEQLKLVDMSAAKMTSEDVDLSGDQDAAFMAPELHRGVLHSKAADMFALATVVWEILVGEQPWASMGSRMIRYWVARGGRPSIPMDTVSIYQFIMRGGWREGSKERLTASEALETVKIIDKHIPADLRFFP